MEPEPGALRTVSRDLRPVRLPLREAQRVATSLMARASGIVSVDRWAFGEIPSPRGTASMAETLATARPVARREPPPKLCAGCHLDTLRANRDDAIHGNGSGCSSCHVARRLPGAVPRPHPAVDARVTDDRCLGCHSRSGRIALTYEGLYEVETDQAGACGRRAASRSTTAAPPAAPRPTSTALAGLSCIDCHLHTDLMGDGRRREHEEEQVEITCEACHGPVREGGEVPWREVKDQISREIREQRRTKKRGIFLERVRAGRGGAPGMRRARLGRRGTPILNLLRNSSVFSSSSSSTWTPHPQARRRRSAGEADSAGREPHPEGARAAHVQRLSRRVGAHLHDVPHHVRSGEEQWDFAAAKETAGRVGRALGGIRLGAPACSASARTAGSSRRCPG